MKSYRDLEVYELAYELAIEVHELTMKLSTNYMSRVAKSGVHQNELKILLPKDLEGEGIRANS